MFLLNTVCFIQEMRALKNAESALNCMAELREMLEHEKANNVAHLDRLMTPMEYHEQDKMQISKKISNQIRSNKGKPKTLTLFQSCATLKNY